MEREISYPSSTAIMAIPLYVPQLRQVVCGSFGSWHWGQRERLGGESLICPRRLSRRAREILCLGFAIANVPS